MSDKPEIISQKEISAMSEEDKAEKIAHYFKKRIPKPLFVRVRDYVRIIGANYIIRRNEFGGAVYVVGKAYRKLSTRIEVDHALKMGKLVAQWGNKYFLYTRITPDIARPLLEIVWKEDIKRGIPQPECSDYDKDSFDI